MAGLRYGGWLQRENDAAARSQRNEWLAERNHEEMRFEPKIPTLNAGPPSEPYHDGWLKGERERMGTNNPTGRAKRHAYRWLLYSMLALLTCYHLYGESLIQVPLKAPDQFLTKICTAHYPTVNQTKVEEFERFLDEAENELSALKAENRHLKEQLGQALTESLTKQSTSMDTLREMMVSLIAGVGGYKLSHKMY